MKVRRFVERGRDSLRQVYLDARRSAFEWLNTDSLDLTDFDRETVGETIWVAERNGSFVGFVSVQTRDNFIHHLFVHPSSMGQGCGTKLLAACSAEIGRPARLKCLASNRNALLFYQAKGWRKVDEGVSEEGAYHLLEMLKR